MTKNVGYVSIIRHFPLICICINTTTNSEAAFKSLPHSLPKEYIEQYIDISNTY